MADSWDDSTYVLNSKYRVAVIRHLATRGLATPTQIANSSDLRKPHISRAISELSDRELVESLAPDEPSRRHFYRLTSAGKTIWDRHREEFQPIVLNKIKPRTDGERHILADLQDILGTHLRSVARFDGEVLSVLYLDEDIAARVSDRQLVETFRTVLYDRDRSGLEEDQRSGLLAFDVMGFENFTTLRIYLAPDDWLLVSADPEATFELPTLVEKCIQPLQTIESVTELGMKL